MLINQKWGPSPQTILQIYKQCARPIFEYGVISTITVSDTVITKLQKLQNSFIRLALHLPRYISTRLLLETSGLPNVKDRLSAVATGQLRNSSRNPLVYPASRVGLQQSPSSTFPTFYISISRLCKPTSIFEQNRPTEKNIEDGGE